MDRPYVIPFTCPNCGHKGTTDTDNEQVVHKSMLCSECATKCPECKMNCKDHTFACSIGRLEKVQKDPIYNPTYTTPRYDTPNCTECEVIVANGVVLHESGCPNDNYEEQMHEEDLDYGDDE